MKSKAEQKFLVELGESARRAGAVWQKIPDTVGKFSHKKPFDAFVYRDNHLIVLEAKAVKSGNFLKSRLEEHQIKGLLDWLRQGAEALVVVKWGGRPVKAAAVDIVRLMVEAETKKGRGEPETFSYDELEAMGRAVRPYREDKRTLWHGLMTGDRRPRGLIT